MDGIELIPENLPETYAAFQARLPWIGTLAREQLMLSLLAKKDEMSPGMMEAFKLQSATIEKIVENFTKQEIHDGIAIYGVDSITYDETMFVVISPENSIIFASNVPFEVPEIDVAGFISDPKDMVWDAILRFVGELQNDLQNTLMLQCITTTISLYLNDKCNDVNETIYDIRKTGGTPCFVVLVLQNEAKRTGGMMTVLALPPSYETQKLLAKSAGNA